MLYVEIKNKFVDLFFYKECMQPSSNLTKSSSKTTLLRMINKPSTSSQIINGTSTSLGMIKDATRTSGSISDQFIVQSVRLAPLEEKDHDPQLCVEVIKAKWRESLYLMCEKVDIVLVDFVVFESVFVVVVVVVQMVDE